jgi:hypothetical protein
MAVQIKIQLAPEAERIVANLQTLPPRVLNYIAAAMQQTNQLALRNVKLRLVGVGPFPAVEHRLGRRSGSLFAGVRASQPVISGNTVETSIGTNTVNKGVNYAAVHEFGAVIASRATRNKNKNFAKRHPQTKGYTLPARAPFQTGIGETLPDYNRNISAAIVEAMNSLDKN